MKILWPVESVRADVCSSRCIRLVGVLPDEAEKIGLLASILGWEVERLEVERLDVERLEVERLEVERLDEAGRRRGRASRANRHVDVLDMGHPKPDWLMSAGASAVRAKDNATEFGGGRSSIVTGPFCREAFGTEAFSLETFGPEAFGPEASGPDTSGPDAAGQDTLGQDTLGHDALGLAVAEGEWGRDAAAAGMRPRLVLRQTGNVIRAQAADAGLAGQLARMGLDRLVLPVPLVALEELLAFAG